MTRILSQKVLENNRKRALKWYYDNKEAVLLKQASIYEEITAPKRKTIRQNLRAQVLDAYGRRCVNCGYDKDERALDLDHINGRRSEGHRKLTTVAIYQIVIRENFPKDKYRILCRNCNWIAFIETLSPK